jgi:hypothetical protein
MPRWLIPFVLAAYCIGILLLLDLAYSNFIHVDERPLRVPDANFDHGLAANFDGYDIHGIQVYPIHTNSLGFKDAAARDIARSINERRIVLIGDSFTEGVGLRFEDTFAGLLYEAGQARKDKIEFLNAGVASYSPTLYYRKIKALLDRGIRFDEVIVFSDISDVPDEATSYFCFDNDLPYRSFCREGTPASYVAVTRSYPRLQRNLIVSYATLNLIERMWHSWFPNQGLMLRQWSEHTAARWTVSRESDPLLRPLGIEGGIKRSLKNMQALADLLASRNIPLTVVVYPWVTQLALDDRDSLQVSMWRTFCTKNCKAFVNLFPAFFAEKSMHADWPSRLFLRGDFHYSEEGNRVMFDTLKTILLADPVQ